MDLEKRLVSGETLTLTENKALGTYTVECWDEDNESRWHRIFRDRAKAEAEFYRFTPREG